MKRLVVGAAIAFALGVAACSGAGSESARTASTSLAAAADTSSTTIAKTTTVPQATSTTAVVALSAEFQSHIEDVLVEWNSGITERWRATFAPEAYTLSGSNRFPIEDVQGQFEFFATLEQRQDLIWCDPVGSLVGGEAATCEVALSHLFADQWGLSPRHLTFSVDVVDGLIVYYTYFGFQDVYARHPAWDDFDLWVVRNHPDDAATALGPYSAERGLILLGFMDEYFEDAPTF